MPESKDPEIAGSTIVADKAFRRIHSNEIWWL
jgi:hypothetical protein